MLPLFRDDFQFLHQKAKCILWNSRRKKKTKDRADALNRALQQIERARSLAEKVRPLNMEYTLYHMCVTKVLILVNIWQQYRTMFWGNKLSHKPVNILHLLFIQLRVTCDQAILFL